MSMPSSREIEIRSMGGNHKGGELEHSLGLKAIEENEKQGKHIKKPHCKGFCVFYLVL